MRKAQGSLEYLIIVAAVIAVSAVVVLSVSGAFGTVKADVSRCKAAASQCSIKQATGTATCSECDAACVDVAGKDVMSGAQGAGLANYYCKRGKVSSVAPAADSSLIALWTFDEDSGTWANDTFGRRLNGTFSGRAAWTTDAKFRKALWVNGSTSTYVRAVTPTANLANAVTLEAWIKIAAYPTGTSGWGGGVISTQGGGYDGVIMSIAEGGQLVFNTGDYYHWLGSTAVLQPGQWYHVAATYDRTLMKIYINGVLNGSLAYAAAAPTTSNNILLGTSFTYTAWFNGTIDEAMVFSRAKSADEILIDANA